MKNKQVTINTGLQNAQVILACIQCTLNQTQSELHSGTASDALEKMDQIAAMQAAHSDILKSLEAAM